MRHRVLRRITRACLPLVLVGGLNSALEAQTRGQFPDHTVVTVAEPSLAADDAAAHPDTYWVFLPGFGINFASDVAHALRPVVSRSGQSLVVTPTPRSLDAHEIAGVIADTVLAGREESTRPVRLRLYGVSMGGILAWQVGKILEEEHPLIVIEAVVFDSSPAGRADVAGFKQQLVALGGRFGNLPDGPAGLPNPLSGGPLDRFALQWAQSVGSRIADGQWPIDMEDTAFQWHKATGVSARGMGNQFELLNSFEAQPDPQAMRYAAFAYLRAGDPSQDTTVDVMRAVDSYASLVAPRPLHVYAVPGGHHASANETPAGYVKVMQAFADEHLVQESARRLGGAIDERF